MNSMYFIRTYPLPYLEQEGPRHHRIETVAVVASLATVRLVRSAGRITSQAT